MSARLATRRWSSVGPKATALKSVPGATRLVGTARGGSCGCAPETGFTTTSRCRSANSRAVSGNVVISVAGTGSPLRWASRNCHGLCRALRAASGWFIQRASLHRSIPYSACADSWVSQEDGWAARAAASPGLRTQMERRPLTSTRRPPTDNWPPQASPAYSPVSATPLVRSAGSNRTTGTPASPSRRTTMSAVTSSSLVRMSTVIVGARDQSSKCVLEPAVEVVVPRVSRIA